VKYCLLVVEGPHDQAFVGRLLQTALSFANFSGELRSLDPFWRRLVPTYPPGVGNLYARLLMPSILSNDSVSCAIQVAQGDSAISKFIRSVTDMSLDAIGTVVDADTESPVERFARLRRDLVQLLPGLPSRPGEVSHDLPLVDARAPVTIVAADQCAGIAEIPGMSL
jgi:hypothetical protein